MKMKMRKRLRSFGILPLLALVLALSCSIPAVAQTFDAQFPAETLLSRVKKISEQGNATVLADQQLVGSTRVTALSAKEITSEQALIRSLESTPFSFRKTAASSYVIVKDPTASQTAPKGRGTLSGTVIDRNGFPVPGATVLVAGTMTGTSTDVKGRFRLEVPARTLAVDVSCISYQTMRIADVKVGAGRTVPLDVVLQDADEKIEEVVVTASYDRASAEGMYARQRARSVMSDGLSADMIKRTTDNNLGQVLKRMSGVVVNDNKYIAVRGLSEQYNNVTLNGSSLSSTEPNRKNFSFDLIPTALIDNVTIVKTFTPDMQGEFAGGTVEVSTLSIPTEGFVTLNAGTGFNTASTGKDFYTGPRYGADWFLGNPSERQWYGRDYKNNIYNTYFRDLNGTINPSDRDAAYKMASKIPNHFGLYKYKGQPMQNYGITAGRPFHLKGGHTLGIVAAVNYRHEENTTNFDVINFTKPDYSSHGGHEFGFVTTAGAIANMGWEYKGHSLKWNNLFNNRFTNSSIRRIVNDDSGNNLYETYSSPLRTYLWQTRLEGDHTLLDGALRITWSGDLNGMNRNSPDDRLTMRYLMEGEDGKPLLGENGEYLLNRPFWGENIKRIGEGHVKYGNLDEKKQNVTLNAEYNFQVGDNRQKVKAGYWGTFRQADYVEQYLKPWLGDTGDAFNMGGLNDLQLYDPQNILNGHFIYYPAGQKSLWEDYYHGRQKMHAAYLMGEFQFLRRLRVTAGVRMEHNDMRNTTAHPSASYRDTVNVLKATDWLPAVNAVYNLSDKLAVRASYSRTLARPDFRDLGPYEYWNVSNRLLYVGIRPLKQTAIQNADIRLEWYPEAGEIISAGFFYKKFKDPVEHLITNPQTAGNYQFWSFNLDKSELYGLEFNLRKSFGFLAPGSFLMDLFLTANVTWIHGEVQYNEKAVNEALYGTRPNPGEENTVTPDRKRPLEGMAPYTVNAGLNYEGKFFSIAMSYNVNGRKIALTGPKMLDDEYEAPRHLLDAQIAFRLLRQRMEIKLNASDLLAQDYIHYLNYYKYEMLDNVEHVSHLEYNKDGDRIRNKYRRGTTFTLNVSYKF